VWGARFTGWGPVPHRRAGRQGRLWHCVSISSIPHVERESKAGMEGWRRLAAGGGDWGPMVNFEWRILNGEWRRTDEGMPWRAACADADGRRHGTGADPLSAAIRTRRWRLRASATRRSVGRGWRACARGFSAAGDPVAVQPGHHWPGSVRPGSVRPGSGRPGPARLTRPSLPTPQRRGSLPTIVQPRRISAQGHAVRWTGMAWRTRIRTRFSA